MTIKKQAISGVKWTTFSTVVRSVIQLAQLSIIAHFLSAQVLGLYALIQVCLAFCQLFVSAGIGNAIVHQQNTSHRHLSELFFINVAVSVLLAFFVYLLSPFFSWFFEQPALQEYIELLTIVFIIIALSRVHLAQLQKKMAFSAIAKAELFSSVIGFIVMIALLNSDFGIDALIYGYLASTFMQSVFLWCACDFRPTFCYPKSWHKLQAYLSFGVYQTGSSLVNYFNSQFDVILVGKFFGTEILGGYSLVRQFCFRPAMVINPVLTRVAFPVMAKLQQSDKLAGVFCKLSQALALINFPLYVAFIIFAKAIVSVFFGENWLHLVPLFQLMAFWCLVRSAINPIGSLLMAVGKVKLAFYWNSFLLLLYPICIILGSYWGVTGVATSLLLLQIGLLPGQWWFLLQKSAAISFTAFLNAFTIPLLASIAAGIVAGGLVSLLSEQPDWQQLSVGLFCGGIMYVLLLAKFTPQFRQLFNNRFSLEP